MLLFWQFCFGGHHTKHQTRDWIRMSMVHKPYIRLGTATLFTLLHDAAGLFSASSTIGNNINFFPHDWQNILVILIPIVFFDCTSELMLIHFHDLPLCQLRPYNVTAIRIALVGQIITALSWISLFGLVLYETIFSKCLGAESFINCTALMSGVSASMVVFLVFIRNAMTLKDYKDRVYVYPIICDESLLFLYHFARNKPNEIVSSIEKFHDLNRSVFELDWKSEPTYQAIISFVTLLLMDIAGITSVIPLIVRPSIGESILRAFPFVIVIILDIISAVLILLYHDLILCNQEERKFEKVKNKRMFNIGWVLLVLVNLAWIVSLLYMIYVVATLDCNNICQCVVEGTDITTSGVCLFNNTLNIPPNLYNSSLINCTMTSSALTCIHSNPTWTGCLLLGLVLTDALFGLLDVYFRSHVLPITIPDYVLYLLYWMTEDTDKIVTAIGKHEFGLEFTIDDLNAATE